MSNVYRKIREVLSYSPVSGVAKPMAEYSLILPAFP
jgi:hypothetical protein